VLPTYVIIPLLLMFVPTFLMGLSFSLSQLMLQDHHEEVGRKVGWLQFINIVGSALGAWWVTWVGFPALGTATLIKGVTGLGLLYAAMLLWRRHQGALATTGMATMVAGVAFLVPGNEAFWRTINGILEPERFLYAENESGLSIIKQLEMEDDLRGVVFANGLGQSSMPYRTGGVHTVLGVLPVLLHPWPERVAVIGLGSGASLFGAAARPETRELVCFEIMSNQAGVLRRYAEREDDRAVLRTLDDPRLRLILHDGRYRLNVMPERYDLIEADALRPNSAFSGNIYSREYFQLVRSRLRPGGMAVTWSPTPRVHATFCSVFPHVVGVDGFVLLGSNEPIALDTAAIRQRMAEPFTQQLFLTCAISMTSRAKP
jgi:spermidine synthase